MEIDTSQILFSNSFQVTDHITVRHATLGDVIDLGEQRYFSVLSRLTAIPSDEKYFLFKNGMDWEELSDLEFFSIMVNSMPKEDSEIFLPGLDFSRFRLYRRDDGETLFADKGRGIVIDFRSHKMMQDILCSIHKIKKKVEKAGNAFTKEILIEEDKDRHQRQSANPKEFKSSLTPLISSMVNREGFKYDYDSVKRMRYGQFMDAAARQQLIVATDQLIQGIYGGNVDAKKIDKKRLDWTREI